MEIKNILLGLVISIVFLMFCVFGTKLIYDSPQYEDFCNNSYYRPVEKLSDNCNVTKVLREKMDSCYDQGGIARYEYDDEGCENDLTCDFCNKEYDDANKIYTKNLFLISIIIGVIIIAFSVLVIKISAVSGGLMAGSLFFILYGTTGYWRFMDDLLRFIILGVALGILIWLAYYLKRRKK